MRNLEQYILRNVALGNKSAFEELFYDFQPKLLAFILGMTHEPELSRDICQEIFLSIWQNKEKLETIESFSSYLYQMARFKVFDYFDHIAVTEQYITTYLSKESLYESDEERLFACELKAIINNAVDKMSPQRKHVFIMSREQGLSNQEIALRLNISKRTVENHLTAVLSILRKIVYCWIILRYIQW